MTTSTGNGRRCKANTRRGDPCGAYAVKNSLFCFWHDPTRAQERKAARSSGGRARHGRRLLPAGDVGPVVIESAADTLPVLSGAINDILALENSIARGRALGYLAGVIVRAFEATELQARVEALEAAQRRR